MPAVIQIPPAEDLRLLVGPRSDWAKRCGERVGFRRTALRLSIDSLAESLGVSTMTIRRIEAGEIVPRDYLRLGISLALVEDVANLWPPLNRLDVMEKTS